LHISTSSISNDLNLKRAVSIYYVFDVTSFLDVDTEITINEHYIIVTHKETKYGTSLNVYRKKLTCHKSSKRGIHSYCQKNV
jgi:hypothetical protein